MARVLVVDDDAEIRQLLQLALTQAGYEVAEAADGVEACRVQREEPADLVITDIVMPEKEGLETIQDLRRDTPHVKIIAISGGGCSTADNYLSMATAFGADASLEKPFRIAELLAELQRLIGSSDS